MLVAVAAMAFTACTETNDEVNANVEKRVFKFVAGFADDTRSGFLEKEEGAKAYKSAWDGTEWLKVYADGVAQDDVKIEDAEGHFSVELTGNPTHINVYSPASAWDSTTEPTIPAEQTPSANSVDPAAHILKAEYVAVNSGVVTMSHAVAYGKMTVNAPSTFKISYVEVSFKGGDVYTIKADNVENNTFWFATKPAEVSEFTVKAYNADGKAVAKIVDVAAAGKTLKFNEGRVSTFSVSGLKAVVEQSSYVLVTDAADLEAGDEVVIASSGFDCAMGASRGNNFASVGITKNQDKTITVDDQVLIITLEAGTKANTYAFKTTDGYLYAASSSGNQLKTKETLDANGSWAISIDDMGVATIKAQGSYTRNWIRYNSTNNPPLFSCYESGQTDISIYKKYSDYSGNEVADPLFELDVTELSFKADGESKEVNVIPLNYFEAEVTATTDAEWLSIENDGYTYTVTAKENNDDVREAVITFKSGDISCDVAVAQAASVNNAIEVTVAEFKAAEEDDVTLYRLCGTITGLYGNETSAKSYGNFYLYDGTGTVIIYGLLTPEGEKQTQWTDAEIKVGDDIEVITVRASYNGDAQGKDAIYVDHVSPGTRAFWSFDKTSASFGYEGGEAEIKVTAYNLTEDVEWEFEDGAMFDAYYEDGVVYVTAYENEDEEAYEDILYVTCGDLSQEIALTLAAKPDEGGDQPGTGAAKFVKVTSAPSDWSGTYLIVYETGKLAFNGSLTKLDAGQNRVSVTISDNEIEATDEMKAISFTIEPNEDGYAIKSASGYYIGATSNSNSLLSNQSTKYKNTITFTSANEITIKGSGGAYLRYNASSGTSNERFRYYKSSSYTSQKAIQLYKLQ